MTERPLAFVEVDIARSAAHCYALLCAVDRIPEWVPGVADVWVVEHGDNGRAAEAQFVGMPGRGSLSYRLMYTYDDGARTVRWRTRDGAVRELSGSAGVTARGELGCTLRYGTHVVVGDALPVWAQAVLREETATVVAAAFQRFAERVEPPDPA